MEKRRPLTRAQLAEIILAQNGKCANCGERLDFAGKGQVVDEHLCPLSCGGTNETSNRALYCFGCAKAKTVKETPGRAKAKRHEEGRTQADRRAKAKANGTHKAWPKGRKLQSRGFGQ